ncbi:FAD binding domain-containing protein [Lentzea sp. NPDC004782]|uniref:FAD binding domain-containing protein n=1 Tax=Lentzea sp. NPDC004782 TaxID=3154458 RepID=UPI0033A64FA7
MKPAVFEYQEPRSLGEAVAVLATPGRECVVLAGGQSLVPLLNLRRVRPRIVVDVNQVPELTGVHITDDVVRIGAMTRLRDIERHAGLRSALPVLPETAALVAYPQIRTRTTIGGSLCHADPAAELPTLAVALGARLLLRSARGDRIEDAESFFAPPGTSRRPDELLTEIELPRRQGFRFRFEEATRSGGFPLVGVCLGVRVDERGLVAEALVAAGGVAEHPVRLPAGERLLHGRDLAGNVDDVVSAVSAVLTPPTNTHATAGYRHALLRTLLRRAAAALATGGGN